MVPAFGITGGISSGVSNFGTVDGSSVPPGICAIASRTPNLLTAYHVNAVAPVYFKKVRRVIMSPNLHLFAWGYPLDETAEALKGRKPHATSSTSRQS